jgi:TPP-dependent pyruvate/acetoin dehydrogenase alpha subunit
MSPFRRSIMNTEPFKPTDDATVLLRQMKLIRALEEALIRLPKPGFQLYSSGEEAVSVGVAASLEEGDQMLSSGRSIAPALARGVAPTAVMSELLGKVTGPCNGKGGRGHFADVAAGFFGAHAVVGGNLTIAAGVSLALQRRASGRVAVCHFGDGACGSGSLHETLNLAALWKLPLVLVCANNQYSISTPVQSAIAARPLSSLATPFGIPSATVDGMDVLAVREHARGMVSRARAGEGPSFLECVTYRFHSHSNAVKDSRPLQEVSEWKQRCPIRSLSNRLKNSGHLDAEREAALDREIAAEVKAALEFAENSAFPDPATEALADVG